MTTQMQISEQLLQFDLNKSQAEVYLALLELGQTTVIKLSQKTGIKRTTIYEVLAELEKKHLVAQTKKGSKRLFIAEEPENLERIMEEKKAKLEKLMPILKSLTNTTGEKPVIRYYEGPEGIKDVYRDTLKYKGELCAFVTENIIKKLGGEFAQEYKEKRKNAQISVRAIGPDTDEIIEYKKGDLKDLKETRLVFKEKFPFTIEMNIYANKLAFMSFSEQLGLIIESNEIAKNMKFLFELAWLGVEVKIEKEDDDLDYWGKQ
ncbi:MAG: helix-turn-helix domain-containing protein [Candidatus Moraniibacteriota bacterium]